MLMPFQGVLFIFSIPKGCSGLYAYWSFSPTFSLSYVRKHTILFGDNAYPTPLITFKYLGNGTIKHFILL